MPFRLLFLLWVSGSLARAVAGTEAPASAERGRLIFEQGIGADGRRIVASAGSDGAPLPASFAACANCHGADGRGRSEGGLTVPPITWDQLDKPYGATLPDGRQRSAYDEPGFYVAVTRGVDPSSRRLSSAMPRYTLTPHESDDLAAYLRQIGKRPVPGVTDDTILLGWQAPAGVSATIGMQVLEAWCAETNRAGGVFRRQVKPVALGDTATQVFGVIAMGEAGPDADTALALARRGVPVLVAGPAPDKAPERWLFALFPTGANPPVAEAMPQQAVEEYRGFALRHELPARELELQFAVLASARLLLEALKNTGRDLDQEKFRATLETLAEVDAGFIPPAGFTRRRHVATTGAYPVPPALRATD